MLAGLIRDQKEIGGLQDQQPGIHLLARPLPQGQQFATRIRLDWYLAFQQLGHRLATGSMIGDGLALQGHSLLSQIAAGFCWQ
ncbi:hypothetical protein D3C80_2000150 [compost metagenome]